MIFSCEEEVICLTSVNGKDTLADKMPKLCSTQEEADTKIILHVLHISQRARDSIIFRSPDTDVTSLNSSVLFDTGAGDKRRLVDVKAAALDLSEEICFHCYTGCDTSSAFIRKGKLGPFKLLQKHTSFLTAFQDLGRYPSPYDETMKSLESFTCLLYGR